MEDRYEEIQEYFGDDVSDSNDSFENYRKSIITVVAYLIGVAEEKLANEDKFDIEETIESIITNYILFKNNSAHIISPKEYEKVIKKDESAHIFKFNNV